jgi:hypothetical protein
MQVGSVLDETEAMHLAARLRELPAAQGDLPDNVGVALQALVAAMPAEPPDAQTPVVEKPASRLTLSSLVLVLANLIPVFGVLLHGWDLGNIMVLFWAESGIIGFYHLLKIAVRHRWLTLLLGPLFAGQFGAFMAIHFLLIYGLFIQGLSGNGPGDSLPEVAQVLVNLWPALLALLLSHGISFMLNFPDRAAVGLLKVSNDMTGPYQRIAIMHVTIIVGGFLSLALGEPLMALILLILLKMTADLRAHRRQHLPPGSH